MLEWYINRLRSMSVKELVFRLFQHIKGKREEKFASRKKSFTGLLKSNNNILGIVPFRLIPENGRTINIFETEFSYSEPYDINWHKDLVSGKEFPRHFYSKINIRSSSDLSAKRVWEVNRMQFLTDLCLKYSAYKDPSDLQLFTDILLSWSDKNPYLLGVNWYSNIEVNLRLITWFLCWEILDAENLMRENDDFREFSGLIWIPLIEEHCLYSYEHPSKHSSANNHLISEYAGLFIASAKWTFRNSEKWIKYSQKGLEREILLQHSENGVNREEAAEYIQFITDFFLLSYIVGERTGKSFSAEYRERLYKILCYIYDIIDCKGNFPKYGDEDDGRCFILDFNKDFNNFRSLLTSAAIIYNDSRFKSKDNGFDIKNRILFGEQAKGKYNSIPSNELLEGSDRKSVV